MDLFDIVAARSCSSGGSGLIVVDQNYSPKSQNAQSGLAVAEAVKNVEKHYSTMLSITEFNKKEISYKNNTITPFYFYFSKNLISGNRNQITIEVKLASSFVDGATGEEFIIFSHVPKDLSKITSTTFGIETDGQTLLISWEELEGIFIDSLPSDSIIEHSIQTSRYGKGDIVYDLYEEGLHIETEDIATSDTIFAEIEPLLSSTSKIIINYKEIEINTQEGEWLYD